MPKKDMRFLCYPYMRETSCMVDFEIRTDSLAARIGLAASLTQTYSEVYADLMHLAKMAYHLNGSVRGQLAITEEDLKWLCEIYDFYGDGSNHSNLYLLFRLRIPGIRKNEKSRGTGIGDGITKEALEI